MNLPPDVRLQEVSFDPARHEQREALLSAEERARLGTFRSIKRQRAFVLGRTSARLLLADQMGLPPEAVPLRVTADGAVEVEGAPYCLSITHTEARAVAAVAERAIGVDLERIRPRRPDLHRFLLHPDEYDLLDVLASDRTSALILCWTLKEATLKAMRTGFRCSPKDVRLDVDLAASSVAAHVQGRRWPLGFEQCDGCYLAVAYAETESGRAAEPHAAPHRRSRSAHNAPPTSPATAPPTSNGRTGSVGATSASA